MFLIRTHPHTPPQHTPFTLDTDNSWQTDEDWIGQNKDDMTSSPLIEEDISILAS